MPITEVHRALGSWALTLKANTPRSVLDVLQYFGHVTVHTGRHPEGGLGDNLLASSEYTGVLRGRAFDPERFGLEGPGIAFWLGDEEGKGAVIESPVSFVAETPTQTIRDLLPVSVTEGTFNPITGLYTGTHQWETPRSAIDYVCTTMDAEWRVNGDASLDVGYAEDLYVTDPKCLVVRQGAGVDMDLKALQGKVSTQIDVDDFTTRVVLLAQGTEASTVTGDADINPALNPYKDLSGNPVVMTRLVSESTTDATNATARAQLQLNRFSSTRDALSLGTTEYDVFGAARVGDFLNVYDPDIGVYDETNEVMFRGARLYPFKLRMVEVTWPLTEGHAVAYRGPDGVWLDLTDYVQWESGQATMKVGGYSRTLTGGGEVVGTRPVADTSVPAQITWNEPFLLSVYQSPVSGVARGAVNLDWDQPLNEDGTAVLDGSHYEIRYRSGTTPAYPITHDMIEDMGLTFDQLEATGATVENMIMFPITDWQTATAGFDETTFLLQELIPAHPYEAQIRAVDMASPPNRGAWSDLAVWQTTKDDIPPSPPAPPAVAASTLAVQVTHLLGLASGGTFNLERDLHHLEVHGGPEPLFTCDETTLLGKALANYGMIVTEVPLVATFSLDDLNPVYFKVVAVDDAGNKSSSSAAVSATASLVDDAHISSLTASKITAGEIQADVFVGADVTGGALHVIGEAGIDVTGGGNVVIEDGALIIKNASGDIIVELGECQDGRHGLQVYDDSGTRLARVGELASVSAHGIEVISDSGALVAIDTLAFGMEAGTLAALVSTTLTAFNGNTPTCTVIVGDSGRCIVNVSCFVIAPGVGAGSAGFFGDGPGASAVAADVSRVVSIGANQNLGAGRSFLCEGLTPGTWTFAMTYRSTTAGQLSQYLERQISAQPF